MLIIMDNAVALQRKNAKYYICAVIGVAIMLFFGYLPTFSAVTELGMKVLGIFLGAIFCFSTVGCFWPALLALVLFGTSGLYEGGMTATFTAAFGSDTWMFVLFVLAFAAMVNNSGASKVMANWMASRTFTKGRPWVVSWLLLTVAYIIGALISVTPGIVITWAILYDMCKGYGYKPHDKYPTIMVIGIVFAALMGQAALPFKAAPIMYMNALSTATEGATTVSYASFALLAIPVSYAASVSVLIPMKFIFSVDVSNIKTSDYVYSSEEIRFTSYQKQIMLFLVSFFILLFLPGLFTKAGGFIGWLKAIGSTATCVLLLIVAGFIKKKDDSSFVDMAKTFKDGIPWETMMILAFAVIATAAMTNASCGIKDTISNMLTPIFGGGTGSGMFIFLVLLLSAVITNFIGNLIVGLMFVPIVVSFAGSPAHMQMLVTAIAVTTNMSLFLPSASPLAALLHSNTEWSSSNDIYKYSWPIVIISVIVVFVICITLGNVIF